MLEPLIGSRPAAITAQQSVGNDAGKTLGTRDGISKTTVWTN
jgi:hypothetical protein